MQKPLLTLEELDALLGGAAPTSGERVDKYYPIKVYLVLGVALMFVVRLLFQNEATSKSLYPSGNVPDFVSGYLYFRGWFALSLAGLFFYSYQNRRHLPVVCAGILAFSALSLLFDLFSIFVEQLHAPSALFTIRLAMRVAGIGLMFSCMRHANAAPRGLDKWNPLLPFRKN